MVLHQDSFSQFSRQPPTAFEPRFDFPDQLITCKGRKCSATRIYDNDFELPLNHLLRPPQALITKISGTAQAL
jgi:hypothetical protein